ncbi:phytanoyl-CoA dioxygenase family protein [Muriicola sp. Z0-33]|uniref:phytanoyl-CoA dioxygenase family protein n=1 Tax=Muriicola sp. Z0-33 TaxID=2816957 RepID=UPI0022378D0C|nr:phytanoyl-CoA dioxygenase family protein [Muriicola sp. Z0-33]MCW5517888.1 phytanoyl-CoA dioxygenase family protein [Muriicola sp. Z0-33]
MSKQSEIEITDCGRIGIYYLKLIWNHYQRLKTNQSEVSKLEWKYINGVFNALGIGTEPAIKYLMLSNPSFEQFEKWIEENGRISQPIIKQFNAVVSGKNIGPVQCDEKVFSESELAQWHEDGYIILRNAIPKSDCEKTTKLIYNTIEATNSDPVTWYKPHPLKQGIMIRLFNTSILDRNRFSKKIQIAYQQLWNRKDLLVTMDRVSFNPPENDFYKFPGPNLHWDVSLKRPIPFGLQGLLYLTDTEENQGAFTVIPGFHRNIEKWLNDLDINVNPRDPSLLQGFKKKPIAAKAGDFIIWNQCLPHGSSPNTSDKPRIVQYINYQPIDLEYQMDWV